MITLDAKRLWISGGYGVHNGFEDSVRFVQRYGSERGYPGDVVELVLVEFFLELNEEPEKWKFEGNVCPCGCGIDKSGTAAVHEILRRLDERGGQFVQNLNELVSKDMNAKIAAYIAKQDAEFIAENSIPWIDKNLPTFKRWWTNGTKFIRNPNTRSDA